MRKKLNGIEGSHILRGVIPSVLAVIAMMVSVIGWLSIGKNLDPWMLAPIGVLMGGSVYVIILWILRVPELRTITDAVLRRLKR